MPGFPNVRTRRAPITALALALAVLPAGVAHAASPPVITKVSPMKVEIGQTLTIKGRGFRAGAFKNIVAFKRSRKPAVFVKVPTATTTQLTFPVPEKLLPFLQDASGKAGVRQFRLRVLAKRFGKAFTSAKLSPRVGPPGSNGGDPTPPGATPACKAVLTSETTDTDKDGLSDALETRLKTDPCSLDSDGDGVSDGYEYESALDLNSRALPYPGKRQWPNPLDGTDAAAGLRPGRPVDDRRVRPVDVHHGRALPAHVLRRRPGHERQRQRHARSRPRPPYLDINGNGVLTDDEKDADGDRLGNWDETQRPHAAPAGGAGAYPNEIQYVGGDGASPLIETSAGRPRQRRRRAARRRRRPGPRRLDELRRDQPPARLRRRQPTTGSTRTTRACRTTCPAPARCTRPSRTRGRRSASARSARRR